MSGIYLLMTITKRCVGRRLLSCYEKTGIPASFCMLAQGTATSETLDFLGLEVTEKLVTLTVASSDTWIQAKREMEENWQHSARAIARFKAHKGMSDEEFEDFLDRVHHVCEHVFMHDFTTEILELLFKGINYDLDLGNTERIAEIRGRNERILSERPPREGSPLPQLSGIGGGENPDEGRSAAFGFRRRGSVWDL